MCAAYSVLTALCIFPRNLFIASGFTVDHSSGHGIPRKEISRLKIKLKLIETYLRSLIQQ